MLLFEGWSAKDSWERQELMRESVRGYIKDPPKAGSRWEKRGKTRLNRFSDRLNRFPPGRSRFTNLLSRRLDRIQNRLSKGKSGSTGFPKRSAVTFLIALTIRQVRAGMAEEQSQNRLNRFQDRLNRFPGLKTKCWGLVLKC